MVGDGVGGPANSLPFLQARMHAFVYAMNNNIMWDRAYVWISTFSSSIRHLGLMDERTLACLPWAESESARRTMWGAAILDGAVLNGAVLITARMNSRQLTLGDELGMLRLPMPENPWTSTIAVRPHLPYPTVEAILAGPVDSSTDPADAKATLSELALSAFLIHLLARISRFHRWCTAQGLQSFALGEETEADLRGLKEMSEIEGDVKIWRDSMDNHVNSGGSDIPFAAIPRLTASWEGIWAALHGPSAITGALANILLMRLRWTKRHHPDHRAQTLLPKRLFPEGVLGRTLTAWSLTPSFLVAFQHASSAAEALEAAYASDSYGSSDHPSNSFGKAELDLALAHAAVILLTSASLSMYSGAASTYSEWIIHQATMVMRELGWTASALGRAGVNEMVEWICQEMTEHGGVDASTYTSHLPSVWT
ncbi:hypothetical protein M427DRAFT_57175, partial [Gonapodya prolifera JEL478]